MREITTHKVNGCNEALKVEVVDKPGAGGASHEYRIAGYVFGPDSNRVHGITHIRFQNGPIAAVGINGITHEVLLAIVIDRLEGFQDGPFACEENGSALYYLKRAVDMLKSRTLARVSRGVEGTHTV